MNLKHAEILISINKHQNITKAAQELNLKQPTVTFHMKNMENDFDSILFRHTSGKVLLTDSGKALLHYAEKIILLSKDAKNVINAFSLNESRTFKIGGSMIPSKYILPEILIGFKDIYPKLHISLTIKSAPHISEMISNFDLDLGIISTTEDKISDNLRYEYICEDEMVLVYSPLSLANWNSCTNSDSDCNIYSASVDNSTDVVNTFDINCNTVTNNTNFTANNTSDIFNNDSDINTCRNIKWTSQQFLKDYIESQNFILHNKKSTTGLLTSQWINENNLNLNSYLEIGSSEIIKNMVVSNLGISILPLICVKDEIKNGTLLYSKLFNNSFNRGIYIIYNKERVMLPVVSEFINFVKGKSN